MTSNEVREFDMKIDTNNIKSMAQGRRIMRQLGEKREANIDELIGILGDLDINDVHDVLQAASIIADIMKEVREIDQVLEDLRSV
jgi:hypothetical protein